MKVLLVIPHVFSPRKNSLYSSQTEDKRSMKQEALRAATIGNIERHQTYHSIHASLGPRGPIVTRRSESVMGVNLTIQLFTPSAATLAMGLPEHYAVQRLEPEVSDWMNVPLLAVRRLLEQSSDYDLVGYLEDDLLIEDPEFFHKVAWLDAQTDGSYAFFPHRCEIIPGVGDVILSGDPDGGRPDLFWDTGETLCVNWPLGERCFYRATNPHSGCFFLTRRQALGLLHHWQQRNWIPDFQLAGPLEQASTGLLLPVFKIMKPTVQHYRFLMVRHQDELWKRHPFEQG